MIRKLDELGRIVIPVEIRKVYDLKEGDGLEIIEKDNEIVIKKCLDTYCPKCLKKCSHTDKFCSKCGLYFKTIDIWKGKQGEHVGVVKDEMHTLKN